MMSFGEKHAEVMCAAFVVESLIRTSKTVM